MSNNGEMGGREKVFWAIVLFAFLLLQFHSFDVERKAKVDFERIAHQPPPARR